MKFVQIFMAKYNQMTIQRDLSGSTHVLIRFWSGSSWNFWPLLTSVDAVNAKNRTWQVSVYNPPPNPTPWDDIIYGAPPKVLQTREKNFAASTLIYTITSSLPTITLEPYYFDSGIRPLLIWWLYLICIMLEIQQEKIVLNEA